MAFGGCGLDLAGVSIKTKKCSFQYLNAQDAPILPQNKTRQARMATTDRMVEGEVNGKMSYLGSRRKLRSLEVTL